ncbi:DUF6230 family protein [Spirillospora albida]|uniref:DUF6230 family protein n=1 Tax=Spirillospora albida TaxID=58123 RepID=UPI0004C116D0|nr:DUF6230 family protein [Spirillospora albida]
MNESSQAPDDDPAETAAGGVRWRRFAAVALPAAACAGALMFMTGQGAIASSFAVSGSSFKVSADHIDGTGFAQYGGARVEAGGKRHPVQVSVIQDAKIYNLCQSVKVLGVTLRLTAGTDKKNPVHATDLVLDVEQLKADALFEDIEIGRDAGTLDRAGRNSRGPAGAFGQQARTVRLSDVEQTAWATTAGTFRLSDLHMGFGDECFR